MLKEKFAEESLTIMTEMVFPNDTNTLNNLMGGRLLYLMDVAAAIAAQKHANSQVVTASVDNVSFKEPIPLGSVVTIRAKVTRAFNSSMEVYLDVFAENIPAQLKIQSNTAFYTFVALANNGKPAPIPDIIPQTAEEKDLFVGALQRRQLRLVLAGRMKPVEATELQQLLATVKN